MSSTLEQVKPETVAIIEARAKMTGLSVDDYLRSILPSQQKDISLAPSDDEFEADMASFADVTVRLNGYKGTYTRDDIYFDHD